MNNLQTWQCNICDLWNFQSTIKCIACFHINPNPIAPTCDEESDRSQYTNPDYDIISLITGYIRSISPSSIITEIIQCITSFHWPKLYDDFNAFKFKRDLDTNEEYKNFKNFKYFVMPLTELKTHYLLPFLEVNNTNKTAKYSSVNSLHCLPSIKPENCMIHEVKLDKNNENIYHLMDSFVVNKFVELFDNMESKTNDETNETLPKGKGFYRSGFRCVGCQKHRQSESDNFKYKQKLRNLWIFIGGNFDILTLNKTVFLNKCLRNKFNINLQEIDEDYGMQEKQWRFLQRLDKSKNDKLNNNQLLHLFHTGFGKWPWPGNITLDAFSSHFRSYMYKNDKLSTYFDFLSCKQICLYLLCDIAEKKLNEEQFEYIFKILNEWKIKLNLEEDIKNGMIKHEQTQNQNEEDVDDGYNSEDYWCNDVLNEPFKGYWTSWKEICINANNLEDDLYPILMTDFVFSNNYMYGSNALSGADVDDWETQRGIFGKMFIGLFDQKYRQDKKSKVRAFWCQHNAWDLYNEENALSGDKMLCCVDNEKIVALWTLVYRLYG
eukprot:219412_1